MRIFLTFGSPEREICQHLCDALRAAGHDPWFEQDWSDAGGGWRGRVAEKLRDTDAVVFCVSRHSLRRDSVCREELGIALDVVGGNLHTVLLETVDERDIPLPLPRRHPVDMRTWRNLLPESSRVFQVWFDEKMEELLGSLNASASVKFASRSDTLRNRLLLYLDGTKPDSLLRKPFAGREWLTKAVRQWLDNPSGPSLCVLYGEPGTGKSAFAARFSQYNPRVAAAVFCERGPMADSGARAVVTALVYQLARRLPDYREALDADLDAESRLDRKNAGELFEALVLRPLSAMPVRDAGTMCIMLDGIDESARKGNRELAETLAQSAPRLPPWIRILAASRPVDAVRKPLTDVPHVSLALEGREHMDDLRACFVQRLGRRYQGDPLWGPALEHLVRRSGGVFWYAELTAAKIGAGKLPLRNPDAFPQGLDGAFRHWFEWTFSDPREYEDTCQHALSLLSAAPEPLPDDELQWLCDWEAEEYDAFLRRMKPFLRLETDPLGRNTVALATELLPLWLRDREQAGPWFASRREGVRAMGEAFSAQLRADVRELSAYEAFHVAGLLYAMGEKDAWDAVMMDENLLWKLLEEGDSLRTHGRLAAAQRFFLRASQMASLAEKRRGEPEDFWNVSACYERIGEIRWLIKDKDGALDAYRRNLAAMGKLLKDPRIQNDPNFADLVKKAKAGPSSPAAGRKDQPSAAAQKRSAIQRKLVNAQKDPRSVLNLATLHQKIGRLLEQSGGTGSAFSRYKDALTQAEKLVQQRGVLWDYEVLGYICYYLALCAGTLEQRREYAKRGLEAVETPSMQKSSPGLYHILRDGFEEILHGKGPEAKR